MTTPYTVETRSIGWLTPQSVLVAYMPKADFLSLVQETIENVSHTPEDITELQNLTLGVAKDMERFALSAWFEPERGCGCLVGETLIAGTEIDFLSEQDFDPNISAREKMAEAWGDDTPNDCDTAERILRERYDDVTTKLLFDLGTDIDEAVRVRLGERIDDVDEDAFCGARQIKSVIFV